MQWPKDGAKLQLLLQCYEDGNQASTGLEASECLADDRTESPGAVSGSHGMAWGGGGGEQVAQADGLLVGVDHAPDLSTQRERAPTFRRLAVQDDSRPVVSRPGDNPGNSLIVGGVAHRNRVDAGENHDRAGLGWPIPGDLELFRDVCADQLNVARDRQVTVAVDVAGDGYAPVEDRSEAARVVMTEYAPAVWVVADAEDAVQPVAFPDDSGVVAALAEDALECFAFSDDPSPAVPDYTIVICSTVSTDPRYSRAVRYS
jgi:hypothetical protein